MPTPCVFNCSMERLFNVSTPGSLINLADANEDHNLYFEKSGTGTKEQRTLRFTKNGSDVLTVSLNDSGGAKPANGVTTAYQSTIRPNLQSYDVTPEAERGFYAETELSSNPNVSVVFRIVPYGVYYDVVRYLTISGSELTFPSDLQNRILILDDAGTKKPLGGEAFFLSKAFKQSKQVSFNAEDLEIKISLKGLK